MELRKENEQYKKQFEDIKCNILVPSITEKNFIPISVIQNKKSEIGSTFDMREEWYTKQYIIELLDEILEKGNK